MVLHRGFKCWIKCEGKVLEGYQQMVDGSTKDVGVASEVVTVGVSLHIYIHHVAKSVTEFLCMLAGLL